MFINWDAIMEYIGMFLVIGFVPIWIIIGEIIDARNEATKNGDIE